MQGNFTHLQSICFFKECFIMVACHIEWVFHFFTDWLSSKRLRYNLNKLQTYIHFMCFSWIFFCYYCCYYYWMQRVYIDWLYASLSPATAPTSVSPSIGTMRFSFDINVYLVTKCVKRWHKYVSLSNSSKTRRWWKYAWEKMR